ncbi:MAG TPA: hypothetical protein VMN58_10315 [Acidimicrobiales bacterium]|nr:hypothetical protein [Acidimicrobiales bacterium]
MGHIADLSLADVLRGAGRYRPVVLTVAAIAVTALVLGPISGGGDEVTTDLLASPPTTQPGAGSDGDTDRDETDDGAGPTAPTPPSPALGSAFTRSPAFSPTPNRSPSPAPTPAPSDPQPGDGGLGPAPVYDSGDEDDDPLVVTTTLWTSRQAGTPLASAGVPEGALPVGNRLGQHDKLTYLRFDGTGALTLAEDPEGTREPSPAGEIDLLACQVTDPGWEEGEAASFDDAPAHDDAACTPGARADDGTWTFMLSGMDGAAGVVVMPGEGAPVDFQVALVPAP